jgi:amino acid adenylation domain-containing protein
LFRSGDRARYLADGTIELLGRDDQQIKLRGFRIELGEIEGALGDHRDIATSVVVPHSLAGKGDERLVAYVVPRAEAVEIESLRRYLKRRLPDYMVPALFVQCADLPLNANGKIDRHNLPEPRDPVTDTRQQIPPRTPVEADLCSLFAEVLDTNRVGIHDSFFDLGGHSLLATQLVSRIRDALDVELPVRTLFESPTPAALTRSVSRIPPGSIVPLRKAAGTDDVPASYAQQRLWFLAQLEPGSTAYHLHWAGRLFGAIDRVALNRAITALLKRHATLRSTFSDCDGMPLQHVAENISIHVNFSRVPAASASFVGQWVNDHIAAPFDLSTGPLLRVNLLQIDEHEHVLAIVMHHIISDGWSMSVLFRELATAYNAFRNNAAPHWPPLPVQYADYAVWQREALADIELERQITYWRAQLADAPAALKLPTDNPRPAIQGSRGAWINRRLPEDLCGSLHELGRDEGCTLFMVLLAAFDVVLGHYAGQQDVLVGTPIAGRNRTELEGLIGFFVNTLVLRTDLSGNPSFRDLLARVKTAALGAYAHQDVPFERLVDELKPDRDTSRTPVFQVMFNLHNEPVNVLSLDGLDVEPLGLDRGTAKFDLTLSLTESDRALFMSYEYNADLFDRETVAGISAYYESVLSSVVREPGQRIGVLAGLARVAGARARSVTVPRSGTLVEAFTAQVSSSAKRLAVKTASHEWSYGALNARANRVAHGVLAVLPGSGDGYNPRVGLMCGQDAPLLAGMLGILKAGAAYVPLDPDHPPARLAGVVADAGIEVVVADAVHAGSAGRLGRVVDIGALSGLPEHDPAVSVSADALAYIIYTSGTTGEPKGVMQTHRGVLQQIARYSESLQLCAEDRLSLLSGYGFDAAVQDIFGGLLAGAAVYPVAMRASMRAGVSSSELVDQLVSARITVLHATPTVYRYLLGGELSCAHDLSCIRLVVLGGEAVRRADFEIFKARFARGTQFVNGLGLTESTLALQYFADHDTRLLGQVVPVGEAVGGMEVELLDESGMPSWYGEIVLTGAGIAAGYWGQPALTQQCFEPGEAGTVYRTGDIGRRLPDGQIAYVGRCDEQVKIRGYRVELGEIESQLAAHPQVSTCVAALAEGPGDARLVAYVVASPGATLVSDELRAYLAAHLPDYMLPQGYELVEQLPTLANGKVDRSRLPAPQWGRAAQPVYVPPRTELEDLLTGIWLDVLQLDEVGVHDDFFALGGHSLLATRLISRLRDHLDLEVPLLSLFESPTISALSAAIQALKDKDYLPPIVTISRAERRAGNAQAGRNHREK